MVNNAETPRDGSLAVSSIDGEFTLKRVRMVKDRILLVPANSKYKTIEVTQDNDFAVWGVVNWILKKV